ncbi:outer membrane protein assembly factor BamC [Alcaligenaceae bacterium A4P071]|nr:outer membrane protein assembly factor BamC [Alcaligenaceae bacterium B3P038]MDQ2147529.1 outer membrane protein assembly factor BamC [Alcaligenaceae bacterium C4P045]MDQ2184862.1 outer membrane protein assembly factor BamC [Alcaligenaceae bacterium A4P071]
MNTRHVGVSAIMAALLALGGCSSINQMLGREESIDYKSTAPRGDPLSIPPDLTQAANDPRYRAPSSGSATFSEYQQQGQAQMQQGAATKASNVLVQPEGMRVERDGDLRWLVIDQPPEALFPRIVDFWTDTGFTLQTNDPKSGLIETAWAENRSKIPESWLRQALGTILDSAYDSGQREKFRTRVERVGNRTEIYVSHQQMEEKRIGYDGMQVRWEPGAEDPGLNAAMIARLMVYLGTDVNQAKQIVASAEKSPQKPTVQGVSSDGTGLMISESFDRAWRRVGIALDSGGFAVDDRDRSTGEYFVRYVDTDTGVQNEQPSIFSRLFGGDKRAAAAQYRIKLVEQAGTTRVSVLDPNGQRDNSATAQRLLGVLRDKM